MKQKACGGCKFLEKGFTKRNMFNDDEFGDYIIYSVHPNIRFSSTAEWICMAWIILKTTLPWFISSLDGKISSKNIASIGWFWMRHSIFSRHLMGRNDWKLIYSDKVANIFVRNISKNQDILQHDSNWITGSRESTNRERWDPLKLINHSKGRVISKHFPPPSLSPQRPEYGK